jgi:hypothetical protein
MDVRHLLVDTHTHLPAAATLAGLSPADAARHVGGVPHSSRAEGEAAPIVVSAALGWPGVAEEAWPEVRDDFVNGQERLARVVGQLEPDAPLEPAFEMPMLSGYTARDVWEHVAQHNAHHLGQVVILRQFLGLWPPPAGSFTW